MSRSDHEKWTRKYEAKPQLLEFREPSALVARYALRGEGARALDLACGAGRNTLALAKEHYEVDAVDIAEAAVEAMMVTMMQYGVQEYVAPICRDLDDFEVQADHYDLIVMTNYLDRGLIERCKTGLKKEGLFIVETYMVDETNEKKGSDLSNLLQPQELKEIFRDGFSVLEYAEFENEPHEIYRMKKQSIVVKKL